MQTASRRSERDTADLQRPPRSAAPSLVLVQEIAAVSKNVGSGELCDLIYREERVGNKLESGDRLRHEVVLSMTPSADLHAENANIFDSPFNAMTSGASVDAPRK